MLLLDVVMPERDGYHVLEELKSDVHLRDIPVVMTSALDELDSVVKCVEMGAEDYLTKPINPVLLDARVTASVEKKRFGAPVPQEDHRLRAVLAACQMVELIGLFNVEQEARGKVEIQIGIGIASGPVVAGYTGTQHRATYTCVGDTVNVAARLEARTKELGRPILLDENTRMGLHDGIAVEARGELQLKGKRDPVKVYAVSVEAPVVGSAQQ